MKRDVDLNKNAVMVRTGIKFSTATMTMGYLGRGLISNLAKDAILEDMDALILDRKILEALDLCAAADIFAAADADRYMPRQESERVQYFALGRYLGHIFFSSLSGAFFGSRELMERESFEALPRYWNPAAFALDLRRYESAKADLFGSNVIHVPFAAAELPEPPATGTSRHMYCLIVRRGESPRVALHLENCLPVRGYEIADRLISFESGFPDKKLDEEAPLENTMFGLLLPIVRKVGFFVRRRRRNGFIMGTPPGDPYVIDEPEVP